MTVDGADGRAARPVAVVTGASGGIGRATAVAFARRGYAVALLARGRDGLEGARREVEAAGGAALVIPLDVADSDAVFAAAKAVVDRWGRIDAWVNNAMATVVGPLDRVSPAEIRRVTEVTYLGAVYGTLAALEPMRRQDSGVIVQIGSALAYRSIPLQAPYCGAKHALRGFTDGLRTELIHDGSRVRLTAVQLPGVNTTQFTWSRTHLPNRHQPVGAVVQPEAVAELIVDAAERGPREVWVGLSAMQAILGSMVAPGFLDRYLGSAAYEAQVSDEPVPEGDEGILFAPASGDRGARGPFDDRAASRVLALNPVAVKGGLALLALGAFAGAFALGRRSGRSPEGRRRPP